MRYNKEIIKYFIYLKTALLRYGMNNEYYLFVTEQLSAIIIMLLWLKP